MAACRCTCVWTMEPPGCAHSPGACRQQVRDAQHHRQQCCRHTQPGLDFTQAGRLNALAACTTLERKHKRGWCTPGRVRGRALRQQDELVQAAAGLARLSHKHGHRALRAGQAHGRRHDRQVVRRLHAWQLHRLPHARWACARARAPSGCGELEGRCSARALARPPHAAITACASSSRLIRDF